MHREVFTMKDVILAISIDKRSTAAPTVQEVLTKYGEMIHFRLGLHDLSRRKQRKRPDPVAGNRRRCQNSGFADRIVGAGFGKSTGNGTGIIPDRIQKQGLPHGEGASRQSFFVGGPSLQPRQKPMRKYNGQVQWAKCNGQVQ